MQSTASAFIALANEIIARIEEERRGEWWESVCSLAVELNSHGFGRPAFSIVYRHFERIAGEPEFLIYPPEVKTGWDTYLEQEPFAALSVDVREGVDEFSDVWVLSVDPLTGEHRACCPWFSDRQACFYAGDAGDGLIGAEFARACLQRWVRYVAGSNQTQAPTEAGNLVAECATGLFDELARWAQDSHLFGKQLRVLEVLIENDGRTPLSDLASEVGWVWPFDNAFNSIRGHLNKKLRKVGWKVSRRDNKARLIAIKSSAEMHPS